MNKKVIARQIPYDAQEIPLFFFEPSEYNYLNISVTGNRNFQEMVTDEFEKVRELLTSGEIAEAVEMFQDSGECYFFPFFNNITEVFNSEMPKNNGKSYSTVEVAKLKKLFVDFGCYDEAQTIAQVLTIKTGKLYTSKTICGIGQSDWNEVIFCVDEWTEKQLTYFETEYFNTGSEWLIDDVVYYAHEWNQDVMKQELADAAGLNVNDIEFQAFSGYTKEPKYTTI